MPTETMPTDADLFTAHTRPLYPVGAVFRSPRDAEIYRYVKNPSTTTSITPGEGCCFNLFIDRKNGQMAIANTPSEQGGQSMAVIPPLQYGFVQVAGQGRMPFIIGNSWGSGQGLKMQASTKNSVLATSAAHRVTMTCDGAPCAAANSPLPLRLAMERL